MILSKEIHKGLREKYIEKIIQFSIDHDVYECLFSSTKSPSYKNFGRIF